VNKYVSLENMVLISDLYTKREVSRAVFSLI